MTGMKIDLDIIRSWVANWEKAGSANKKASQIAAVMLSRVLAETEARAARVEKLLDEMILEGNILNRIEKKLSPLKQVTCGASAGILRECKEHRRKITMILREADELLKEPVADQSIQAGGLLLEIGRGKHSCKGGSSCK